MGCDASRFVGGHPLAGRETVRRRPCREGRPLRRTPLGAHAVGPDRRRGRWSRLARWASSAAPKSVTMTAGAPRRGRRPGVARPAGHGEPHRSSAGRRGRRPRGAGRPGRARRHADRGLGPGPVDRDPRRERRVPSSPCWTRCRRTWTRFGPSCAARAPEAECAWSGGIRSSDDMSTQSRFVGRGRGAVLSVANAGRARMPGKHGAPPTTYVTVPVVVPDQPGRAGPAARRLRRGRRQRRGRHDRALAGSAGRPRRARRTAGGRAAPGRRPARSAAGRSTSSAHAQAAAAPSASPGTLGGDRADRR